MKVVICMGARCAMMGANGIYDAVEYLKENIHNFDIETDENAEIDIELGHCLNYCRQSNINEASPVVIIDGEVMLRASAQEVSAKIIDKLRI
ncbi:NAD(P)H-dependent oxidoreductase subunit E [Peptoniphilus sp. GNH]|nr:hypothetical protein HMPREF3189_01027 [Clostridiales bacterium KA00134]UHR02447.1 NAD(P)H-dependent oxidoreductase subunit E [Peptoniphilus sp. GNH]